MKFRELPSPHRRRTEVAGLAGPHNVVQRFADLLHRCVEIETMDLPEAFAHAAVVSAELEADLRGRGVWTPVTAVQVAADPICTSGVVWNYCSCGECELNGPANWGTLGAPNWPECTGRTITQSPATLTAPRYRALERTHLAEIAAAGQEEPVEVALEDPGRRARMDEAYANWKSRQK